ncbi:IS200/IS605 family transposase [Kitasatospora aureofaciens]|nr:IS200/IS605 family transposase [Streptomyces viridifaciens]
MIRVHHDAAGTARGLGLRTRPRPPHRALPAEDRLSRLVGSLKGVSARRLRQEFPTHIRKYLWGAHFWSLSYFAASCGGVPLSIIKEYIENQKRPE